MTEPAGPPSPDAPPAHPPCLRSNRAWINVGSLIVVLVAIVYWPGLAGPFIGDDAANILSNPMVQVHDLNVDSLIGAATAHDSGPTGRALPALSFGLDYYRAGQTFDSATFKITNLAIHLLNTVLVLMFMRQLLCVTPIGDRASALALAAVATTIWAIHPLQLTNVLYVVQRMNSMVGTFVLLGLIVFMLGRQRLIAAAPGAWPLMLTGIIGGTALGALCKENVVVLPGLALVLELTVLRGQVANAEAKRSLRWFYGVTVGLPYIAALGIAFFYYGGFAETYITRGFTAIERLLTQPVVLWWYLGQWVAPDIVQMSVHHDNWTASTGLFAPPQTAWALAAGLLTCAAAVASVRFTPWFALAVFWFLMGHSLESSIVPLELVFEHRNYLPTVGLSIGLTVLGWQLIQRFSDTRLVTRVAAGLIIVVLAITTYGRAIIWSDLATLVVSTASKKPQSARAQLDLANLMHVTGQPGEKLYPAYRRVEQLSDTGSVRIGTLEILLKLRRAHESGEQPLPAQIIADDGAILLEPTPQGFDAEIERITAAQERQFASGAVRILDIESTRRMVSCYEHGAPHCKLLGPSLRRWLNAGIDNPRTGAHAIQVLTWLQARLQLVDGNRDGGLATMARAVAMDPTALTVRHQQVLALMRSGFNDEARAQLKTLETIKGDARHRLEVRVLREMLAE
jgi:hypothetical protein